ncbi:MAG: 2'-5' RNA ligase family protein [Propionivibrio sp.]|uniref:2'-5' RNA ligase family protein n=1 Tax=Propionivibrio sp. TaxID=2212460 RepID=UPI001A3ECF37|nr:2'-5' RNA ligase family protein [Propionivibrio sp.]MBL8413627.1 2'-5' RNA ligase family protein [Propionivibrio sp.]
MTSRTQTESTAHADLDTAWTVASIQRDFVDWRKGRPRYAVWAIDLDIPKLCAASLRVRQHLERYLLPHYGRKPHITVCICGFPGSADGLDDDYTPALFKSHIASLESARLRPFSLAIGRPETFTTAAYFTVHDQEAGIARIRQALGSDGPGEKDSTYVPHVTFGLYREQFPVAEVLQRMQSCPDLMSAHVEVGKLVLMTYEASVITGPLTAVCEFNFERQALRVLDENAMDVMLR